MDLEIDDDYNIYLQYGLFDSPDDTDQDKLHGNIDINDPNELPIVPVSNQKMLDAISMGI